jgi:UDPglucose--hexose-1-phosphate uridylyltransferase
MPAEAAAEQPSATPRTVTRGWLADGRDILYFDERPTTNERVDRRTLSSVSARPSIRYDPLTGEWVTIAGHRQDRTHLPAQHDCPLCPSRDGRATEIPASDYDVVVFENRFPSYARLPHSGSGDELADDRFSQRPGVGRCEVICFTSDHDASFSQLSAARVRTVLEAWIERTHALSQLRDIEQVFCFENRGEEIGVTLSHPHGQIYGYPFLTPRTERSLTLARDHQHRTGRNLFADNLAAELASSERVVHQSAHWSAFVPFAARWPVELHLYPHRHLPDLPALTEAERADLCEIYPRLLRRAEVAFGSPLPYIAAWHQAPVRHGRDLAYLHLQLFSIRRAPGKLKYLAGSESAMGAFINDRAPEETARILREADA